MLKAAVVLCALMAATASARVTCAAIRCRPGTTCVKKKQGAVCQAEKYNCYTKEVWSEAKKTWCCKNKGLGCDPCATVPCTQPVCEFGEFLATPAGECCSQCVSGDSELYESIIDVVVLREAVAVWKEEIVTAKNAVVAEKAALERAEQYLKDAIEAGSPTTQLEFQIMLLQTSVQLRERQERAVTEKAADVEKQLDAALALDGVEAIVRNLDASVLLGMDFKAELASGIKLLVEIASLRGVIPSVLPEEKELAVGSNREEMVSKLRDSAAKIREAAQKQFVVSIVTSAITVAAGGVFTPNTVHLLKARSSSIAVAMTRAQ